MAIAYLPSTIRDTDPVLVIHDDEIVDGGLPGMMPETQNDRLETLFPHAVVE